jgi:Gpi18-like mannosyltransferase
LKTCQPCPNTYPWIGNTGFAKSWPELWTLNDNWILFLKWYCVKFFFSLAL